jgi:hypothetical protein
MTPWERLDTEGAKAFEAFALYRDLGPSERSVREVARRLNKSATLIGKWSGQHAWVERCVAWDAEQDRIRRDAMAKEAELMGERHARLARRVLDLAAQRIDALDPNDLPVHQLARLMAEASKLERLALGEPSDRIETSAPATPDEVKRFLAGAE